MDERNAFEIFIKVFRFVNGHNLKFENGTSDFSVAINAFADWSPEKLKSILTEGNRLPPYEFSNFTIRPKEVINIDNTMFPPGPTFVDWKSKGHVTGIKDQGSVW